MERYILSYDLGTGGNKASLYDTHGNCMAESFVSYETRYPAPGWHEQSPMDWWNAVVLSTSKLLSKAKVDKYEINCLGISGQSLSVVAVDKEGNLLRECTPIWSDSRATSQVERFMERIDEAQWYSITGNGFPPPLYSVFKIMWFRDNEPEMFRNIGKVIGSKDFINYKLTGRIATDYSYASGSGVYDLKEWTYSDDLIEASGLPQEIFPEIVPSTEVLGHLTKEASQALGLPHTVKIVAGGVDNSCMALGARNIKEGRVYNSIGSSSWIAVSSEKPLLDEHTRPFVFAHVIPGMFTSATSIFSAGSSFRWIRDQFCQHLMKQAEKQNADPYELMTELAAESPVGSNKLLFNPSLAGGTSLDDSINVRGAYIGLDLGHTQADIIRAAMEGIAMGMRLALDALRKLTRISDEMVVVGGGSRSELWRQIFADVYNLNITKTNIDQQAAALGAAAIAAAGAGLWNDFSRIDDIHQVQSIAKPIPENNEIYERLIPIYIRAGRSAAEIGEMLSKLDKSIQ